MREWAAGGGTGEGRFVTVPEAAEASSSSLANESTLSLRSRCDNVEEAETEEEAEDGTGADAGGEGVRVGVEVGVVAEDREAVGDGSGLTAPPAAAEAEAEAALCEPPEGLTVPKSNSTSPPSPSLPEPALERDPPCEPGLGALIIMRLLRPFFGRLLSGPSISPSPSPPAALAPPAPPAAEAEAAGAGACSACLMRVSLFFSPLSTSSVRSEVFLAVLINLCFSRSFTDGLCTLQHNTARNKHNVRGANQVEEMQESACSGSFWRQRATNSLMFLLN